MSKNGPKFETFYRLLIQQSDQYECNSFTNDQLHKERTKNKSFYNEDIERLIRVHRVKKRSWSKGFAEYVPEEDRIYIPKKNMTRNTKGLDREYHYYATLLHELVHWTGHIKRLDRDDLFGFRDEVDDDRTSARIHYAYEEIIAEMGAALLLIHFGYLDKPSELNLTYIRAFYKDVPMHNRRKLLQSCYRKARKAVKFLLEK